MLRKLYNKYFFAPKLNKFYILNKKYINKKLELLQFHV